MSIHLWLILPQPEQCHQDRLGFPSSAWTIHQRVSIDAGASPDPFVSPSTMPASDSETGTEGAGTIASDVTDVACRGNHHAGARFPSEFAALDGGA